MVRMTHNPFGAYADRARHLSDTLHDAVSESILPVLHTVTEDMRRQAIAQGWSEDEAAQIEHRNGQVGVFGEFAGEAHRREFGDHTSRPTMVIRHPVSREHEYSQEFTDQLHRRLHL